LQALQLKNDNETLREKLAEKEMEIDSFKKDAIQVPELKL